MLHTVLLLFLYDLFSDNEVTLYNPPTHTHTHTQDEDYVEVAVITNTSHLLQLVLVVTSPDSNKTTSSSPSNATTASGPTKWSGIEGLAHMFMDAVAPTSGVELVQWPEEDSLKYTLE